MKISQHRLRITVEETGVLEWPKRLMNPELVAEFLQAQIGDLMQEHMILLSCKQTNEVIGMDVLSIGTPTATLLDLATAMRLLLLSGATRFIIAHNHPSGSLKPSMEDESCTRKAIEAGNIMGIPLVDHMVITQTGYYSFHENQPELFESTLSRVAEVSIC